MNRHGKLGISSLVFREYDLTAALERIRRTSLTKVDISMILPTFCPHYDPMSTGKEDDLKLKEIVRSHGIKISTLNIVPGYFNVNPSNYVERFIKRSIDMARLLGAHSVTIPSGARVETKRWERDVMVVKKHLLEVNQYAREKGVVLSLETPHVRTLTETLEESKRFHEILEEPTIKCTLDTSHVRRLGGVQPLDAVKIFGVDRINHVHLRDAVGDDISFTPGKGTCDFKSFFGFLESQSYSGDYILELEYEDLQEYQRFREIEFAIDFCNQLLISGKLSNLKLIQTTNPVKFVQRVARNPKTEIKRHRRILRYLKVVKDKIKPYMPEKVYEGTWKRKMRWGKTRVVRHKKHSVQLLGKPTGITTVGIIGCGWAGMEMHAPGFQRLENVEIVGAYDIDAVRTDRFSERFSARACRSLDELIMDVRPHLISVCSREWVHYEAAVMALQNGVDVFCEKLLATRYKDGVEMVDTATKHNRTLGVNYNYRYMPGIRKIKEIIVQQALGKLSFLNINVHAFSYAHALDLLTFLGGRITSISAYLKNDNDVRQFGGTDWSVYDDDILYVPSIVVSVTVEFEKGYIGVVNSSYYYPLHTFVLSIESIFERGVVTLNGINMFNTLGNLTYHSRGSIRKVNMEYKKDVYSRGYEYTFYESIKDFTECYRSGKQAPVTGEQALFNMYLEKMVAESNKSGTKIALADFQV